MDTTLLTFVTGLATAVLAFAFGFPQWVRVRRTGSVEGISLASITNSLISDLAWMLYGFHLRDVWVITTSANPRGGSPGRPIEITVLGRGAGDTVPSTTLTVVPDAGRG